jgi:hypothetical protein
MARHRATSEGNIAFTAEEELQADREEQVWTDGATERAMAELRTQRNRLLADSDFSQLPDAPVNRDEWATYRQSLRDLPANTPDINNPVYPIKP